MIGEEGIEHELKSVGIQYAGGTVSPTSRVEEREEQCLPSGARRKSERSEKKARVEREERLPERSEYSFGEEATTDPSSRARERSVERVVERVRTSQRCRQHFRAK